MDTIQTEISTHQLCLDAALKSISDPAHGAINTFIGTVRNTHEGKSVTGITYDVHTNLAKKVFHNICSEAKNAWPLTRYYLSHYQGILSIGEISVIIAVSSPHRAESFEACRYVIEELKRRAPIWKKEHYIDGISDWLPGHSLSHSLSHSFNIESTN